MRHGIETPEPFAAQPTRLEYHLLDVFTDRVGGGNPVAVFVDALGLTDEIMARVARELALSETVFVLPAARVEGTRRLRIFTPTGELPFAGHPTIGTAFLLATIGVVPTPVAGDEARIILEEAVGPVEVRIRFRNGAPEFAELTTAAPPEIGPPPALAHLPTLLSLAPEDIVRDPIAPAAISAGVPYALVPVRDRAALARARLDVDVWERHYSRDWARHFYLHTFDAEMPGSDVRARMFGPALGIPEDPATGAAALDLAAYLATRDERLDGTLRWTIEQGVEMGRPSVLHVSADKRDGRITALRVGGAAVVVGDRRTWRL